MADQKLDDLCINTLRFLAVDAVEKAQSGHPGLPLGAATMAYTLWHRFLKFDPADPNWHNRDRFVLSAGHGSALLYALLHLAGFELSLEALKNFRQWGSQTPGHPEYGHTPATPGVEATTGPLGQGLANAVGMAMAEQVLAARFNRPGHAIVDHYTYVLASDGDMMEGVVAEAASLAGHLQLGKLIVLYDDNQISIEGRTALAFSENVAARFEAYGWHTISVPEGQNVEAIADAIAAAQNMTDKPSLLCVRTQIGFGSPNKEDKAEAHGEPLGKEELKLTKARLGWPTEPMFCVPDEAVTHFQNAAERGKALHAAWSTAFQGYTKHFPELAREYQNAMDRREPDRSENIASAWALFDGGTAPTATRDASGIVLNRIAERMPELIGGSADLGPSTKTSIKGASAFSAENRSGRNLHFGIREHAMGAVMNGMALHRGLVVYGSTFLIFSDYMRPPMRLAAMMGLPVIYVFTHDSIGVGEDGPTHQPVEQVLGLRSIRGLDVVRPADANETVLAWKLAIEQKRHPTALILTRQKLPVLDPKQYPSIQSGLFAGAYTLHDTSKGDVPELILLATGSEVHLALQAQALLAKDGLGVRVVSCPCWSRFETQDEGYKRSVLPEGAKYLSIEAGTSLGWKSYMGMAGLPSAMFVETVSVDRYGASAPGPIVMDKLGISTSVVCEKARRLLQK